MNYLKIHLNFSFLLSLVIPLLILGPFFPDLIVSLSSLVFFIYVFRYKIFFYFNKKPVIIFFIFCIYCIFLSIFVAENIVLDMLDSTELVEAVRVYVGGILQTSGYTVTGSNPVTVDFDTAPNAGYQVSIRIVQGQSWYEPGSGTASNGIALQEQTTAAARFIQGLT